MAAVQDLAVTSASHDEVPDDLTDEQIQQMLSDASARLKTRPLTTDVGQPSRWNFPKLNPGKLHRSYMSDDGTVARLDSRTMLEEKHRKQADEVRRVEPKSSAKKAALEKKKADAGSDWFNLPKTDLTPELKRDLQLLKMRNVLDPHRHYKKDGGKMQAPEYSQVGTIIEGPTEFFSGRVENKNRKRTFVEEVLAGEQQTGRFKRKYGEIQDKKTSGKKGFYKNLKAKRKSGSNRFAG